MCFEFRPITAFPRGTLYALLCDAYAFDPRWAQHYAQDWQSFDDFFFEHPSIAASCGFITVLDGAPIGLMSWDPRALPAYVQLGHNGISSACKGRGYGTRQLLEAIRRIRLRRPQEIRVTTNVGLFPAPRMYERVGFQLAQRRAPAEGDAFAGDLLDYVLISPPEK